MEGNVYVYVDNCSREKYKLALRDIYIYRKVTVIFDRFPVALFARA